MKDVDPDDHCSADCDNAEIAGDVVSVEANESSRKGGDTEGENNSSLDDDGETSESEDTMKNRVDDEIILKGSQDQHDAVPADYGYEEASPEVQRRNEDRRFRRNSLVGRMMVWAGVVNDENFSNDTGDRYAVQQAPMGASRRASIDGAINGAIRPSTAPRPRHRIHSSDDIGSLDDEDREGEGRADYSGESYAEYHEHKDRAPRRNSLHAMVERAVAFVNMKREENDDDLSPFGNRRDSLFS
jgi:hypothetical protein